MYPSERGEEVSLDFQSVKDGEIGSWGLIAIFRLNKKFYVQAVFLV